MFASTAVLKFDITAANTLYWLVPAIVSPRAVLCASVIESHFGFNSDNTSNVLFRLPSVFSTVMPYSARASLFFTIRAAIVDKPLATWLLRPVMISVPAVTKPRISENSFPYVAKPLDATSIAFDRSLVPTLKLFATSLYASITVVAKLASSPNARICETIDEAASSDDTAVSATF